MGSKIESGAHLWGHFPGEPRDTEKKQGSCRGYVQLSAALPHSSGRGAPSEIAVLKTKIRLLARQLSCYFSDNRRRAPWLLAPRRDMVCR